MVKSRRCVVHIGMHKTGSSSIQQYLYSFAGRHGIIYPDFGTPNQSEALYNIFSSAKTSYGYHSYVKRNLSHDQIDKLKKRHRETLISSILSDHSKDVILSAEDLFALSRDSVLRLKSFLQSYFDVVNIVGYIRPIRSYVSSSFQECVKHGQSEYSFTTADPRYDQFLNYYRAFDKVTIITFAPSNIFNGDIVQDFCKQIDLPYFKNSHKIEENASLSKEAVSILYTFLKFTKSPFNFGNNYFYELGTFIDAIRNIGDSKLIFSEDQYSEIIAKNEAILKELSEFDKNILFQERQYLKNEKTISSETDILDCAISQWDNVKALLLEKNRPSNLDRNSYTDFSKMVFSLANQILDRDDVFYEKSSEILSCNSDTTEYQDLLTLPIKWEQYHDQNKVSNDIDPVCHYINNWKKMPLLIGEFNTHFYLSRYPDIRRSGVNPIIHFYKIGKFEGRMPNGSYQNIVIGGGELSRIFQNFSSSSEVVVFASGVSNSSCEDESEFLREEKCIRKTIRQYPNHRFIYFSSCALASVHNTKNNRYYSHKKNMERVVSLCANQYYIFRLPQLFSRFIPGKSTLINFLAERIKLGEKFALNISSYRYILHSSDLLMLVNSILDSGVKNGTYDIANFSRYSVLDIVSAIESELDAKAIFDVTNEKDEYDLDLSWLMDFIQERNIEISFSDKYLQDRLKGFF